MLNILETLITDFRNILIMISQENLGATSEMGTKEKIPIDFKGKFRNNNSLERV